MLALIDKARMILKALDRSQAVIEFKPDGRVIRVNKNFLATMGYTAAEVVGKHHSMFVDSRDRQSSDYQEFWESLRRGEFQRGEFERIDKHGRKVWLQATYNPVTGPSGSVKRVVKFASDITEQKTRQAEIQDRSQAVIEFAPDGTIITANQLFQRTMGYSLEEIQGAHHRKFVAREEADSESYRQFWGRLGRGEYHQGEFRRIAKDGREVWLQGAYNPVFDGRGKVIRVVKSVADITDRVSAKQMASDLGGDMARGVRELSSAIHEISAKMCRTSQLTRSANTSATAASDSVVDLLQRSEDITRVVQVIETLAAQTSLLALNATIEASRAGEAGKGFAVVADEVKTLACETKSATDEIRQSVEEIQRSIDGVVSVIHEISSGVAEVDDNANSVAASVEEQSAVMSEMSSTAEALLSLST